MPIGIGGEQIWLCPSLDTVGQGTTTLTDLSGNGRHTVMQNKSGSDWQVQNGKQSIRFSGDAGHLNLGAAMTSVLNGTAWSISLHARLNQATGAQFLIGKNGVTWDRCIGYSWAANDHIAFGLENVSFGPYGLLPYATYSLDFASLIFTYSAGFIKGYVNGALDGIVSQVSVTPAAQAGDTIVGGGSFGRSFNGWLDDLRIFDFDLSDAQLKRLSRQRGILFSDKQNQQHIGA